MSIVSILEKICYVMYVSTLDSKDPSIDII